ncbi:MAG TPA: TonB-dependent receptor [Verrucomicrobiae bacterium]|nr:TonB-dependent receptor [Verrucomicrobiae bacterium]
MKSNFDQHAVRLGERVLPGFARAHFIATISLLVCTHILPAQTNSQTTVVVPQTAPTNHPTTTPTFSGLPDTNNPSVASPPPAIKNPTVTTPPVAVPLATNNPPVAIAPAPAATNTPAVSPVPASSGSYTNLSTLPEVTVYGRLNRARSQILPDLGATAYSVSQVQIESESQGENAPFNQVVLRAPGVAQDSAANGDLHVRGEHANLQYRINGVLLPEGITGFGLELDPRFVNSLQLITGSLPAEYGFRTAGIIDIQTKDGFENGGEAEMYGGSYDTLRPSFEYGATQGKLNCFIDGSYEQNGIGLENPTDSATPIHDDTRQYKGFTYLSYILDDTSRISLMGSASYSTFQIPNSPGNTNSAFTGAPGQPPTLNSADLDENQNEQNYYGVLAYQKTAGDLNFQLAGYGRFSEAHFLPDPVGDLYFDGAATDLNRSLDSGGFQADGSYLLNEQHTLRAGVMVLQEFLTADTTTTVYPTNSSGNASGPALPIVDNGQQHATFLGVYAQDEWKIVPKLTLNYGVRFDLYSSSFDDENQASPRVNLIYQPTNKTTLHAGYARYFTPPPLENVSSSTVSKFNGTSNEPLVKQDDPVRAERADYFDVGVSQKLMPGLQVGVDGYYKYAHNQLDDGLFGQSQILSAFNYREGRIYGVEFTGSYASGGFSTYANVAYSVAQGKDWASAQFLFDPSDLTYVKNHWIYLDHDQRISGSFGAAYTWKQARGGTRIYIDAIYGSGLRQDGGGFEPNDPSAQIPNGSSVPSYSSVNLGVEQDVNLGKKRVLKARLDVVNITDNIYELRSGSGVGVNAAQYGMRRGIFGSLGIAF